MSAINYKKAGAAAFASAILHNNVLSLHPASHQTLKSIATTDLEIADSELKKMKQLNSIKKNVI